MIDLIYVEDDVRDHPRTVEICRRFPRATVVACERYGEIFNRRRQSFRLQKRRPALILARRHDGHVQEAPVDYGIGSGRGFYFSHMLNCPYDCRYCFLQGMLRSAHYVVFVNYEDFEAAIDRRLAAASGEPCTFFSGYDCDSLAFEGVTGFAEHFLPFFRRRAQAWLELRTKSTRLHPLLRHEPFSKCVVAWSLTPQAVATALEHRTPDVDRRIRAMALVAERGWPVGLRLDPLIWVPELGSHYRRLLEDVFGELSPASVHSVSIGSFRLPRSFHRNLVRLHPHELFLAGPLDDRDGLISYRADLEAELLNGVLDVVRRWIPDERIFLTDGGDIGEGRDAEEQARVERAS